MLRLFAVFGLCCSSVLLSAGVASADWANDMFTSKKHDFGTVARAAKTEHIFEFKNTTGKEIHVSDVRTSCGCTTPEIVTHTVKPGEVGQIKATFNTRSFLGQRGATITVSFDRPNYTEVQLRVDGYIRRDVVCNPGEFDFGNCVAGAENERKINIQYAGRSDWKIVDAKSNIEGLDVKVAETSRENGRVGYELVATFKGESTGLVNGEVELTTNDPNRKTVPIPFTGRIVAPITASPAHIFFGTIAKDASGKKVIVLKGEKEFKVLEVKSTDPRVSAQIGEESKKLHTIPVVVEMNGDESKVEAELTIVTDLPEAPEVKVKACTGKNE